MKIATKQGRKELYEEAITFIETNGLYGAGLCFVLHFLANGMIPEYDGIFPSKGPNYVDIYKEMDVYLPELWKQRPPVKDIMFGYWFEPGEKEPRINALREAIKLC